MRSIIVIALSAFVVLAHANEAPAANPSSDEQAEMEKLVESLNDEQTMNMFVDRFIDKLVGAAFNVLPNLATQYMNPPAIVQSAPMTSQRDLFSTRSDPPVVFVKYELPSKLAQNKANSGISEDNYNSLPGERGVFNGKWGIPVDGNGRRIENIYPNAVDAANKIDLNERTTKGGTENMVPRQMDKNKNEVQFGYKPIDRELLFGSDNYDNLNNIGKDPTYYQTSSLIEEPELISASAMALTGLMVVGSVALAVLHFRRNAKTVTQQPLFGV